MCGAGMTGGSSASITQARQLSPAVAAVAANTGSDLYATADEQDKQALRLLDPLSFIVARRESNFAMLTDPEIAGLGAATGPEGGPQCATL